MPSGQTSAKVVFDIDKIEKSVRDIIHVAEREIAEEAYDAVKSASSFSDKTGNLRKSIRLFESKFENGGWIVHVGAPHAHLVEFGTAERYTAKGKRSGRMPALPFVRPVARKYRSKFQRRIIDGLRQMGGHT